jgi:hypothetical protein
MSSIWTTGQTESDYVHTTRDDRQIAEVNVPALFNIQAGKTHELQFSPVKNSEVPNTRMVVGIPDHLHHVCGVAP